jgi:glycosyltransferase involved in cell wall biosynthesis
MNLRPVRLAVFLAEKLDTGGGYQQSLNAAMLVQQLPRSVAEPVFFTSHKENVPTLHSLGIEATYISLPPIYQVWLKMRALVASNRILMLMRRLVGANVFERIFLKNSIDLIYFLSPSSLATSLDELNYITTVWDLCHRDNVEFPEVRFGREFEARESLYRKLLPKAVGIFVDSPLGKSNVVRRYTVDDERVHVMPFTPSISTALKDNAYEAGYVDIAEKYQLHIPYVFYPAQFWAHKNHVYLLEGLKALEQRFGRKVAAIFSGNDKGNMTHVKKVVSDLGLQDRVRFAGFVPATEIPHLYRQSLALVMPTYFGPTNLPPLEAFSLGVPMLYSDIVGLRDQVGDAALLMDLHDPVSMARHLEALLTDSQLPEQLVQRGREVLSRNDDRSRLSVLTSVVLEFQRKRACWGLTVSPK